MPIRATTELCVLNCVLKSKEKYLWEWETGVCLEWTCQDNPDGNAIRNIGLTSEVLLRKEDIYSCFEF